VDILSSAFRHGIVDEDIRHALRGALVADEIGEDAVRYLVLGPDRAGPGPCWHWIGHKDRLSSTQWR
jgi:hypothetical protein